MDLAHVLRDVLVLVYEMDSVGLSAPLWTDTPICWLDQVLLTHEERVADQESRFRYDTWLFVALTRGNDSLPVPLECMRPTLVKCVWTPETLA